jgi:hypothetical protein
MQYIALVVVLLCIAHAGAFRLQAPSKVAPRMQSILTRASTRNLKQQQSMALYATADDLDDAKSNSEGNGERSSEEKMDMAASDETRKPVGNMQDRFFDLDFKDPQDWLFVILSAVVVYNGLDIFRIVIQQVMNSVK